MYKKMIVALFLWCNIFSAVYGGTSLSHHYVLKAQNQDGSEFCRWVKSKKYQRSFAFNDENRNLINEKISKFTLDDIDILSREIAETLPADHTWQQVQDNFDFYLKGMYGLGTVQGLMVMCLLKKCIESNHRRMDQGIKSLAYGVFGGMGMSFIASYMSAGRNRARWNIEILKALEIQKRMLTSQHY